MSMISAQIDRLRERAKELRNLALDPDVPYLVPSTKETMALAMRSAASEMEDAADTIWQLRDDLQRANAENAKLRELVRGLHMAYIGIIGQCESFDSSLTWEFSGDIDADLAKQHASYEQDRHRFDVAMRELGIEVDG